MAVKTFRPITPSQRYRAVSSFQEITKDKPERRLVVTKKKTGGRNSYGRMTSRTKSGGHKQKIRLVDFKRRRHGEPAKVVAIEYDPIRSARLALIQYEDGRKSYIIAPLGLKVGASVVSGPKVEAKPGNFMPLRDIPIGMTVHNIEIALGGGAKLVRSAGSGATLMSRSDGYAQLKMPSSEIRKINENC
ncbi:MAG: 50S ribosomal protein L2, partial [Verrucomicrobia bacterium]|nr:50S ribosomal protein L2 [Verrucomicrobiota bacterium]